MLEPTILGQILIVNLSSKYSSEVDYMSSQLLWATENCKISL